MIRFLLAAVILLGAFGCANQLNSQGVNTNNSETTPGPILPDSPCTPTDQDQYVWRPARLQVLQPCVRAVGIVMELADTEPDGDLHIHLQLDEPYQTLLTVGNQHANGYLVVEAVCQYVPPFILAIRICASDPDPYRGPFPHEGDHIWVEGRYVLDLVHFAQAELHPLYRWGIANP